MDERRLRYFLAIVEDGGVTRAASRLHVAQPSLSQALRALERELGEPESAAALSTLVRAGECELGLAHLPLPQEDLRTLELGEQELLFVLPPGSQAAVAPRRESGAVQRGTREDALRRESGEEQLRALAPAALREVPLVVSRPGTSTRILLEQALQAVAVIPRIAVETDAREAIVPLVLAGAGAALLPATLAREAGRRGAVVRAARPRIVRRIGLVQRDGPLSPAARAFSALVAA